MVDATVLIEKRLRSIALGRVKVPKPPTISEQLKAAEILMKLGGDEPELERKPLEVKIRVVGGGEKSEE